MNSTFFANFAISGSLIFVSKKVLSAFSVATHNAEDDEIPLSKGISDEIKMFKNLDEILFSSKKICKQPFI